MFKSITFEVTGDNQLHCAACEQRVMRMLKMLEGVQQVRARAETQRIDVLFDDGVLEPAAIAKRLSEAGYDTQVA